MVPRVPARRSSAQKLAAHLTGDRASVEIVQFHPSYAYEDFVEGYRPQQINGQPGVRSRGRATETPRGTGGG